MSSSARDLISVNSTSSTLGELSRLFSPEFFVKKEDLEPFISLLNGIKHEYWDNADRFRVVIGLLYQLKLDVSTQVLEYQQLLIKNRLRYALQDTPDLLETLLEMIDDASNNRRHVLNARPVSVGYKTSRRRQCPAAQSTKPSSAFVLRNNTVTLPWQPWFAHIVPKSSATGKTILRMQGRKPYSFLLPKIPSQVTRGQIQRVVTSTGLVTFQPTSRVSTTNVQSSADNNRLKTKAEFEVSRQIYDEIPSSLQSPASPVGTKVISTMEEETTSSNNTKHALLKKQQEFLKQLALLKTENKTNGQTCQKQLFPLPTTGQYTHPLTEVTGDHPHIGSHDRHTKADIQFEGNHIRIGTRQSTTVPRRQPPKVKYAVTGGNKRRSPRNKDDEEREEPSKKKQAVIRSTAKDDQEEKGLLLSRVSENCIVISVPDQSSTVYASPKILDTNSPAMTKSEKKRKKKKNHRRHRSAKKDRSSCSLSELAFSKVQKLHKKRNRAWKKDLQRASQVTLPVNDTLEHREVHDGEEAVKPTKQMKISSDLFKIKRQLNKNNSCSTEGSDGESVEVVKTPRKRSATGDQHNASSTNLASLLSPSCFVSLKKMKLESSRDTASVMPLKANVRYPVNSSSSFPHSREVSISVNQRLNHTDTSVEEETIDVVHLDTSSLDANASLAFTSTAHAMQGIGPCNTLNNKNMICMPQSMNGMRETLAGAKYPSIHSTTHSFLDRLLASPSTPHHLKNQHAHPRVRRRRTKPQDEASKVRKSKRQKRKRRRQEREAQRNRARGKSSHKQEAKQRNGAKF